MLLAEGDAVLNEDVDDGLCGAGNEGSMVRVKRWDNDFPMGIFDMLL